jgi:hypothetical protein
LFFRSQTGKGRHYSRVLGGLGSGRDMQVDHLNGGELFDGAAWRKAGRQSVKPPAECDAEAVGEEGEVSAATSMAIRRQAVGACLRAAPSRISNSSRVSFISTSWLSRPHSHFS